MKKLFKHAGNRWLSRTVLLFTLATSTVAHAQIPCDNYDFTTATGWSQVNTPVTISSGKITATMSVPGYLPHYVYTTLGTPLGDAWTCDFEFTPTNGSGPNHSLVSFTESSPGTVVSAHGFHTSPSSFMYYTRTHCIEAYIYAPPGTTNADTWLLKGQYKLRTGGAYGTSTVVLIPWITTTGIPLGTGAMNRTFYARLQRLDETHGMVSLFSDAARTILIGSECFPIDPGVDNLTAVQSGNQPEGGASRNFSGTVDNITVCNLSPLLSGSATICASHPAKGYSMWNGNSNVTTSNCGFPGATSFTFSAPAGSTFPSGTAGTCNAGSSGVHNDCSIDVNTSGPVTCAILYSCGTVITYTLNVTVENSATSVITGATTFCQDVPISLSGASSTNETSYSWAAIESDAAGTPLVGATWCVQSFVPGTAGAVDLSTVVGCSFTCGKYFKVRLQTKNSCGTATSYQVIAIQCYSVSLGPDIALCCQNHTVFYTFSPVVTCGVAPFTYSWAQSPAGPLACSHSGAHTATTCPAPCFYWDCAGSRSYTVTVTDAGGNVVNDVMVISTIAGCRMGENTTGDPAASATIYPNPATKQITVNSTGIPDQLFITDALGRQVISLQPAAEQTQINISDLPPGVYFVHIMLGEKMEIERLIIQE
ncbi:MAG: T9SS type A sorting domain-containing protein [Bacteroidia bacterium]